MANWHDGYQVWLSESQSLHNAQFVADHFSGTDWTPKSISALCGNMRHESSINPNMYEYGYSWSADRGFGLVQWTPRSKYWNWATNRGLPQREGESQLSRIDYEVEQNIQWIPIASYNYMTFKEFRTNSGNWSVGYLTEAFTWCYERPNRTAGQNSMPSRKAFANKCYDTLNFDGDVEETYSKPAWPTTEGMPITSPYGWRTHPITGKPDFHGAIDIGGYQQHRPIYATQDGKVTDSSYNSGAGYYIQIEHTKDPYQSRYLHLKQLASKAIGETVTKGEQIGIMGTTGSSTGIHLDFAIGEKGVSFPWGKEETTIDPLKYLEMEFSDGNGGGGGQPPDSGGGIGSSGSDINKTISMLLTDTLNGWRL